MHLYDSGTSAAALAILNLIFSTTNHIRCKQQAHTLPEVMLKMRWMPWCAPDLVWHHASPCYPSGRFTCFKEGKTDILGQEVRVTMASQVLRRRDSCDAVMPSWHEPCRVHLPGEKGCGGDLKTTKMIDESNMCIFGLWSGIRRWEGPLSHLLCTCHIFIALHPHYAQWVAPDCPHVEDYSKRGRGRRSRHILSLQVVRTKRTLLKGEHRTRTNLCKTLCKMMLRERERERDCIRLYNTRYLHIIFIII